MTDTLAALTALRDRLQQTQHNHEVVATVTEDHWRRTRNLELAAQCRRDVEALEVAIRAVVHWPAYEDRDPGDGMPRETRTTDHTAVTP